MSPPNLAEELAKELEQRIDPLEERLRKLEASEDEQETLRVRLAASLRRERHAGDDLVLATDEAERLRRRVEELEQQTYDLRDLIQLAVIEAGCGPNAAALVRPMARAALEPIASMRTMRYRALHAEATLTILRDGLAELEKVNPQPTTAYLLSVAHEAIAAVRKQ